MIVGDLPPYEAFPIGGTNSVRGYSEGGVGSGRNYGAGTAELHFPLFKPLQVPPKLAAPRTVRAKHHGCMRAQRCIVQTVCSMRLLPSHACNAVCACRWHRARCSAITAPT